MKNHKFIVESLKLNTGSKGKQTEVKEELEDLEELQGSVLGTHEYWEQSYSKEIKNYKTHGDVGEVWFEEESQMRIINWMEKNLDRLPLVGFHGGPTSIDNTENSSLRKDLRIVDIGCGNGMFLIELSRLGYKNLHGVDYSAEAINLALTIAKDQDLTDIDYKVLNITDLQACHDYGYGKFDIVHDKGTYDAISLNPNDSPLKRKIYCDVVHDLLQRNGLFIITSCNWSENELMTSFKQNFQLLTTIPTPTFRFGGKIGNLVTSSVFTKKHFSPNVTEIEQNE